VAPPCRCKDSWVAKFSGQTSQGTMKVTQIFALFGHSIAGGRPMFTPLEIFRNPEAIVNPARRSFDWSTGNIWQRNLTVKHCVMPSTSWLLDNQQSCI
jgi:hypothetical protein